LKGLIKIISISSTIFLITVSLVGCLPQKEQVPEVIEFEEPSLVIAPSVQVEEKYYRGLLPFLPSETRGSLQTRLNRYRLDSDRLELGLIEIAQGFFPLETHLFREGQTIDNDDLSMWLKVKSASEKLGLNPEGASERILLHVLEHNYRNLQGDSLEGIVVGLSLASTYTVEREVEEGEEKVIRTEKLHYTADELRNHGARMADIVAERIRSEVNNVPIVVALYQLEEENSLVPGNFLSVGYVEKDENYISKWTAINETYFLFPSNALARFDSERSTTYYQDFSRFGEDVQTYFPNYVGTIGVGRFIDEQLVELTLKVTTEVASKTEVIQLTQFLGGSAVETFPENAHLNIYVQSVNQPQSIFVRPVDGEPLMHIYR
jgi:protein involved in sex pheromone biosynthesis